MNRIDTIENKLQSALNITYMDIADESHRHKGHAEWKPEGETHFRVMIVSSDFSGKNRVIRHKMVYAALDEELKNGIHALALKTLTPEEFERE